MRKTWENFNALPDEQKPASYVIPDAEREFIKQACIVMYWKKHLCEK